MMKAFLLSVVCVLLAAQAVFGEDRVPSQRKLARLGLSSIQPASDEVGSTVRGGAYVIVGGRVAANAGGGWGVLGFGWPFWAGGAGTSEAFSGTAVSGSLLPGGIAPAAAQFGTRHPITQVDSPLFVQSTFTYNGLNATHSSFVSGTVFGAGL